MFERAKIGGSIDYLLRSAGGKRGMGRTRAEVWLHEHSKPYAAEMRRDRLSPDQAAVRLITDLIGGMSADDVINLRQISPDIFSDLKSLFVACDALLKADPSKFGNVFRVPSEPTFYAIVTS